MHFGLPKIDPNVNVNVSTEPIVQWLMIGILGILGIMGANLAIWWFLYKKIAIILDELTKKLKK